MKKIFYTLFFSALVVAAATSCSSDDDNFDSSVTLTPENYVASITSTTESTNSDGVKESKSTTSTFAYDANNRVKSIISTSTYALSNGSKVTTYTTTYTYEENKIIASCIQEIATTISTYEDYQLESSTTTSYNVENFIVELDDNGILSSITCYYGDGDIYKNTLDSVNGRVISYTESCNDTIERGSVATWSNGNIYVIGDDIFDYSSVMLNDCNIDLNMFVSPSEQLENMFYGSEVGFLNEIGGIHSNNMISECREEGYISKILYTTDSLGRIIQSKYDKYGKGNYYIIDVTYF